jgi:hypothetical protein
MMRDEKSEKRWIYAFVIVLVIMLLLAAYGCFESAPPS